MEIYLVMMGIVVLLGIPLIEIKPTKTKKLCYIIIVYLMMLAISVFRYGLGNDYYSYYHILRTVERTSWMRIFGLGYEPGFVLLDKIISCFTMDVQVLFAVYAVLILTATCYAIFMHSENIWMSVMMFISLTFFYNTLSFIRQAMAVSIILLGWRYFKERNHFMVMLFIFFGALFHSTVIIMIPLYFIAVAIKLTKVSVPIYATLITLVFTFSWQILDLGVMIFPQYKNYLGLNYITNGFKPVYIILPSIILGIALLAHFTGYGKAYPKRSSLFTSMAMFSFIFWLISLKHFILERFSMYPYILMIMFIPSVVNYYKQCMLCYFARNRGLSFTPDICVYDSLHKNPRKKKSADKPSEVPATAEAAQISEPAEAIQTSEPAEAMQIPEPAEATQITAPAQADSPSASPDTAQDTNPTEIPDSTEATDSKKSSRDNLKSQLKQKRKNRYSPDTSRYPENYKRRAYSLLPIRFITHPVTVFAFFMAVVISGSLWYNYFGLTVTSAGFHGVVPYRSTVSSYMDLFMANENPADKNKLLRSEKNFYSYLYRITENNNYTTIISSSDDNYNGFNDPLRRLLRRLGFTKLADIEYGYYYIAVVSNGRVVYEESSKEPIDHSITINGYNYSIHSERNNASIMIGEKEYSKNQRGLNIVVMDDSKKTIVDNLRVKAYYIMLAMNRD